MSDWNWYRPSTLTPEEVFAVLNSRGMAAQPAARIVDELLGILPLRDIDAIEELAADYLARHGV